MRLLTKPPFFQLWMQSLKISTREARHSSNHEDRILFCAYFPRRFSNCANQCWVESMAEFDVQEGNNTRGPIYVWEIREGMLGDITTEHNWTNKVHQLSFILLGKIWWLLQGPVFPIEIRVHGIHLRQSRTIVRTWKIGWRWKFGRGSDWCSHQDRWACVIH